MTHDLYTRIVLTIIAAALSVLAGLQLKDAFSPGAAVAGPAKASVQKVAICDESGDFCARVDETSRLFVK